MIAAPRAATRFRIVATVGVGTADLVTVAHRCAAARIAQRIALPVALDPVVRTGWIARVTRCQRAGSASQAEGGQQGATHGPTDHLECLSSGDRAGNDP